MKSAILVNSIVVALAVPNPEDGIERVVTSTCLLRSFGH